MGANKKIEELKSRIEQINNEAITSEPQQRLGYYFKGKNTLTVMNETLDQNGEWKMNYAIKVSDLWKADFPYMDETDKKIVAALLLDAYSRYRYINANSNTYDIYLNSFSIILPYLIGSDRVYHNGKKTEVCTTLPILKFYNDKKGAMIELENGQNGEQYTKDKDCFKILKVSSQQKAIISELTKGTYSLLAIPQLKQLAENLKEKFIIKDFLEDCNLYPTIEGSSKLTARIDNLGNGEFNLNLTVQPVESSPTIFPVGSEGSYYIETICDQKQLVHRTISKENENKKLLIDQIKDLPGVKKMSAQLWKMPVEPLLCALEYMHNNPVQYCIRWSAGKRINYAGKLSQRDPFRISSGINWFEPEGQFQVQDKLYPLKKLLDATGTIDENSYIQLEDGSYAKLTEELKKLLLGLDAICEKGRISVFKIGKLAKTLRESGISTGDNAEYNELLAKMEAAYKSDPVPPVALNATLLDYQIDGYKWIHRLLDWGAGALLADDMGLGKTLQSIAIMLDKKEEGTSLVVVPKSLTLNWESEIKKFAPTLTSSIFKKEIDEKADIIICTYNQLSIYEDILARKEWNVVCLDEGQKIKNHTTNCSKVAMELKAKHKLLLSGTPIQNNYQEIWSLFQFLNPGLLGSYESFMRNVKTEEGLKHIQNNIAPFILHRKKEDVLLDLPEKSEIEWLVRLSGDELKFYEDVREMVADCLKSSKGKVDLNILQHLMKLRRAACAPSLIEQRWEGANSKVSDFMLLLKSLDLSSKGVLVFSQFTSFLDIIKKEIEKEAYDYLYIDGESSVIQRQEAVNAFQKGDKKIFISSIMAGGFGLNLTAAKYVIILDPWWNPSVENQAMDRAYRIGQDEDVTIIRMICRHTIEEKILRLHELKRKLTDDMLMGTSQSNKLTFEEIQYLIQ